jgi:hypothetical protein
MITQQEAEQIAKPYLEKGAEVVFVNENGLVWANNDEDRMESYFENRKESYFTFYKSEQGEQNNNEPPKKRGRKKQS